MSNYFLFQDRKKCIGCHSCEVQCVSNKSLVTGPKPCQIFPEDTTVISSLPEPNFVLMSCFHCENPWCVAACPANAMKKRSGDGIVYVDPLLCIGCKTCITACPWGSVQWDYEKRKAVKCDLCVDRIDQGLNPACVEVCTSRCLEIRKIDQISPELHEKQMPSTMPETADETIPAIQEVKCPVNASIKELECFLDSEITMNPKVRRRAEKILELIMDIAWGRAGDEHLPSIKILAGEVIDLATDETSRKAGQFIEETLAENNEVFLSHVETNNCMAGECVKILPAPCQMTCPAGIDIPSYVTLIGMGRYAEAIDLIRKDNPFPWICGIVCTRPCELMCVRSRIDKPVSIKYLKAFASDQIMLDRKYLNPPKADDKGQKVCILGAGPAGMSAAYYLSLKGYGVTVIEALPTAGGMMYVGIPRYRLPCKVIDLEVSMIEDLGAEFRFNTRFGKDVTLDSLKAEGFEAFFLGIGAHKSLMLGIKGETDYPEVIQSIDLLRRVALGDWTYPGDRAVIIGGGNVAIDAARTCLKLGSKEVTIAYRRTRLEMPADHEEVDQAIEEGIYISYLTIPTEIIGENGKLKGISCIKAEMVAQEGSSRKYPVPIEGSDFLIEADTVISAIGQQVDHGVLSIIPDLKLTRKNTIETNKITMETNLPGFFAAGDAVSGPATVIEAIGGGKRAADAIDRYLSNVPQPKMPPVPVRRARIDWIETSAKTKMELKRPSMNLLPMELRLKTFQMVEIGYPEDKIRDEASRCLRCDVCIRCGKCVEICRDKIKVEALKMGYINFDKPGETDFTVAQDRCILCGSCAANCPTGALNISDVNGERSLSLCGTILSTQDLIHCECCGELMGTARYLEYIRNKHKDVIPVTDSRHLCSICSRKTMADYLKSRFNESELSAE